MSVSRALNASAKPFALVAGALTCILAGTAIVLTLLTPIGVTRLTNAELVPGIEDWIRASTGIAFASVGMLIVWQRGNLVGWLLLVAGLSYTATYEFARRYVSYSLDVHALPASDWMAWLGGWGWIPAFAILLAFLPLVFPSGRLVSSRWSAVGIGAVIATGVLLFCAMFAADNPHAAFPQWHNPLGGGLTAIRVGDNQGPASVAYIAIGVLGLGAFGSLVVRYRRSDHRERRQLQWFGLAVVAVIIGQTVAQSLPQLVVGVFPLAVGIAVLRYHLYDIELVISKALIYSALAAFITLIYLAVVVGLGSLIGSGGRLGLLLGVVATAVVAVAFQPVRERMNRLANQLVFGLPSDPYALLADVARSGMQADVRGVLERVAHAIAQGSDANRVRVRLLLPANRSSTASWPAGTDGPFEDTYPIYHAGSVIGEIQTSRIADREMLTRIAGQAGLAISTVRLSAEVADRVAQLEAQANELAASRARLVAAAEAERRRLERDLHDGVQQELVALIAKVRLARNQLARRPEQAAGTLGELQQGIQRALIDLREVAHGIHPALLSSRGLVEAVEAMAGRMPIGVLVKADPRLRDARYPEEIEGAAYFVVAEGLTNVMKHAAATQASVTISRPDSRLVVAVEDDGHGFLSEASAESGLRGLRDRLEALGGQLSVISRPSGTHLEASLPVPERAGA